MSNFHNITPFIIEISTGGSDNRFEGERLKIECHDIKELLRDNDFKLSDLLLRLNELPGFLENCIFQKNLEKLSGDYFIEKCSNFVLLCSDQNPIAVCYKESRTFDYREIAYYFSNKGFKETVCDDFKCIVDIKYLKYFKLDRREKFSFSKLLSKIFH